MFHFFSFHQNNQTAKFKMYISKQCIISSIFDKYPDRLITLIMAKPYILQETLFHWICSKFIKFYLTWAYFFWPQTSWRLLEAKNIPQRPRWHEWVNLLKKVFNQSCSATSKTPWRVLIWAMNSVKKDRSQDLLERHFKF